MSYNVRKFNMYGWIDDSKIPQKISQYIENESPDVVALQEYRENSNFKLNYPYYSNPLVNNYSDPVENAKHRTSYAVFSKYPIINTGLFKDKRYKVNAIYTDILKERDTIRIVNYHLYSLGVVAEKNYNYSDSKSLLKGLSNSFKHQVEQVDLLNSIIKKTTYKTIIVGDMNNTAYSWAYKNLKSDFKDTFTEAGEKFGKTYSFKGLPLRIDYIFVDMRFEVTEHKNYNVKYSDHYPIMATISF